MPGFALPTKGDGQYLLFGALAVAAVLLTILMRSGANLDDNVITLFIGVLLGLTVYFWRAPLGVRRYHRVRVGPEPLSV